MILWIVLGVLALLSIPFLVGTLLSEQFAGRTEAFFPCSQQDVWTALLDFRKHPMTGRMMKSAEEVKSSEGLLCWSEDMGRGEIIRIRTTESDEPNSMTREMESSKMPMTSQWRYGLQTVEGGCKVSIEGETCIRSGAAMVPLFRFMMFVGGGVKKGFDIQLEMVAKSLGVEKQP